MLKKCHICNKGAVAGKNIVRKGLAKKKGGTGSKIVRSNRRTFFANLQRVRILVKNKPTTVYICAKCIKKGKVTRV